MSLQAISNLLRFILLSAAIGMSTSAAAQALRIGSISDEPNREIERFKPLADYMAAELRDTGIESVDVVIAADIPGMAKLMREGDVDLYIDSPFPTLSVLEISGGEVMLRRWKKGVAEYRSLIFTHKDNRIDSLDDLRGKSLAFEEPFSTSGHFVPKAELLKAGMKLRRLEQARSAVGSDEIGYLFSGDDRNTLSWVWRGRVHAGALNDHKYSRLPAHYQEGLKVIHRSIAIPRHLVSRRADLDSELADKVRALLLQMDQNDNGRVALEAFEKTRRFDELPDDDGLSGIRALAQALNNETVN